MKKVKFSEHYKLNKDQSELDFVDIFVNDDTPLYIDPYVFKLRDDTWSVDCNNLINDFFQTVITSIKDKDSRYAKSLLERLSEPKETHLGVSSGSVSGKGVSGKQAGDLYEKFTKSKAVKTGDLSDISDCELMIPGIGFDKVSDMATNIIREKLIIYTQEQCKLYNIPTKSVPSGLLWSPFEKRWLNGKYVDLPVVDGNKIILVPKHSVVVKPCLSSRELYNFDIVEYIQAEQLTAMSSLVEILKSGKRRVTKKSIKEHPDYKMSKEFIYDFCNKHPEILDLYKTRKGKEIFRVQKLGELDEIVVARLLIEKLNSIPTGNKAASEFHMASLGILEFLFFPHLMYPKKEHEVHEGRKRIDITFHNAATEGFWNNLRTSPTIASTLVMIECKNYTNDISNPELDQMAGRFSNLNGWFGIIVCRKFENKELFTQRCRDTAKDGRGIIMCMDDSDIVSMLELVESGNRKKLDEIMVEHFQNIIN